MCLNPNRPLHFGGDEANKIETLIEQAKLAKEYGIHGFSYYFYGSNDTHLKAMLNNKAVDMPFCLIWMNENAVSDKEIDVRALFQQWMPYFKDERYICIAGKPLFTVYQAHSITNIKQVTEIWREEAAKEGLPGIYLIAAKLLNTDDPEDIGFDALVEFPPYSFAEKVRFHFQKNKLNALTHVFDYRKTTQLLVQAEKPPYKLFRGVMLSFDNTASAAEPREIYHYFTCKIYQHWLSYVVRATHEDKNRDDDEKIVFINAWNAWPQGTHLEPDKKLGYAYLQNTYTVAQNYDKDLFPQMVIKNPHKKNQYAVILHLFFEELWPEIKQHLSSLNAVGFDLYVTVTSVITGLKVKQDFPEAYIQLVENRGRDILPFIKMLALVEPLGYAAICKIHSKKSIHDEQLGTAMRTVLFDYLLGSTEIVMNIITAFNTQENLGLVAPKATLLSHDEYLGNNGPQLDRLCEFLGLHTADKSSLFPAGSMFWFRPPGLKKMLKIPDHFFRLEHGAVDEECEHAVERLFCVAVESEGYQVRACSHCEI
jgi:lipopolysaccharide biosynthesis protein